MRKSGILMPIFSLPSKYGIGTLGADAYKFIDFLKTAGQSYWQILPLNPTNYGDSPYQSFSSYAGNPYFVDIQTLIEEGLLTHAEAEAFDFGDNPERVDYGKLYENRLKLLKLAFSRFEVSDDYISFCNENAFWLDDYSLFMAIKNIHNDACWNEWEKEYKHKNEEKIACARIELTEIIKFYKFVQYKFSKQWQKLKSYANKNGIQIIGDIPIYVAYDSVDVWSEPQQFKLDNDLNPKVIAGCPPDAFSDDGQLWGNPIYDWEYMKKDNYGWWKNRLSYAFKLYDVVRIDHFRGFEAYYTIPFGDETAQNGEWENGPGMDFFNSIKAKLGNELPIIAEDLGYLTPEVLKLLKETGFPGMKVLQFAFDSEEESNYLPHNHIKNCVVYTGTHDNDTIIGWLENSPEDDVKFAKDYLGVKSDSDFGWAMIKSALMSVADTCILMMPDLIGLGSEGRINSPSTLGENWQWRIKGECINDWLAGIIKENTQLYKRLP
ncbi:MAG: 4-alpha-glucanotransferase [Clostridia bacterium]|nr:4-alpha-glucanotransferase [Clostridia bacterium]